MIKQVMIGIFHVALLVMTSCAMAQEVMLDISGTQGKWVSATAAHGGQAPLLWEPSHDLLPSKKVELSGSSIGTPNTLELNAQGGNGKVSISGVSSLFLGMEYKLSSGANCASTGAAKCDAARGTVYIPKRNKSSATITHTAGKTPYLLSRVVFSDDLKTNILNEFKKNSSLPDGTYFGHINITSSFTYRTEQGVLVKRTIQNQLYIKVAYSASELISITKFGNPFISLNYDISNRKITGHTEFTLIATGTFKPGVKLKMALIPTGNEFALRHITHPTTSNSLRYSVKCRECDSGQQYIIKEGFVKNKNTHIENKDISLARNLNFNLDIDIDKTYTDNDKPETGDYQGQFGLIFSLGNI